MRELRRRENQSALSEAEQSRRLYRLTAAMPTAEEYSRRANETYILVKQTQDIWECEAVLRIAAQWERLAAYKTDRLSTPSNALLLRRLPQ
jgi:hypothetical protein